MSYALRPYQRKMVDSTRDFMQRGVHRILNQAPTGSGKTVLTAHMLANAAAKGHQSWFVVHRRELIKQTMDTFDAMDIPYGVVARGFDADEKRMIQICSVQTLTRRFARLKRPKLIIWDECHHVAANSWDRIFRGYPEAYHIGLTATPERLDGTGLDRWFEEMVVGPSVLALIQDGWLASYRMFAPSTVNLKGVHTRMGDFVRSELSAAVNKSTITGDALDHYVRLASGKRGLIFCVSVEHSKAVVRQFQQAGIPSAHVDGETPTAERDRSMAQFRSGEIQILSNCDLFGEGVDVPSLECVILLRPTQSLGLYLQQVGRSLRPAPGKDHAIILDHVGNAMRHGLPDEDREWTLRGRVKKRRNSEAEEQVRICPSCYAAQSPGVAECRFCGHVFEVKAREVEEVEGDLVEVDTALRHKTRMKEQGQLHTLEELVYYAKHNRKMKFPYRWARYVMKARQRRRI